jgi:hypothetical protein
MEGVRGSRFSEEWEEGYDDAFNGRTRRTLGEGKVQSDYDKGFNFGKADRKEVQRDGSSNT